MSDIGEPRCREKRKAAGLPYPRSSCDLCGSLLRPGWRCPESEGISSAGALLQPLGQPGNLSAPTIIGCICPPGANVACERPDCPRKAVRT